MQSLEKGGLKTVFKCFYQPVLVGISFLKGIDTAAWSGYNSILLLWIEMHRCFIVLFSCWEEAIGHVVFLYNPFCYFICRRPVIGHAPFHRKSRFLYWFFWTTTPWATKSNPAHPWASFWRWQSLWREILPLAQKKRDEQAKGMVLFFIIFLKI